MNIQIVFNNIDTFPRIIDIDSGLEIKDIISYSIENKVMTSMNHVSSSDCKYVSSYPTKIILTIKCDQLNIKHEIIDFSEKDNINKQKDKIIDKPVSNFDNLILED